MMRENDDSSVKILKCREILCDNYAFNSDNNDN